jgi:hypothetical protein
LEALATFIVWAAEVLFFFDYPENGGSKILQNVGNESPINTAPCLATSTKVWKTQIT